MIVRLSRAARLRAAGAPGRGTARLGRHEGPPGRFPQCVYGFPFPCVMCAVLMLKLTLPALYRAPSPTVLAFSSLTHLSVVWGCRGHLNCGMRDEYHVASPVFVQASLSHELCCGYELLLGSSGGASEQGVHVSDTDRHAALPWGQATRKRPSYPEAVAPGRRVIHSSCSLS